MEKLLIERTVSKTQAKYELKLKHNTQQNSYNLSLDSFRELLVCNAIESGMEAKDQFKVSDDFNLKLSDAVLNMVDLSNHHEKYNVLFVKTLASDGTEKFQIKRTDNTVDEYSWFKDLYDNNIEGSLFRMSLDVETKEILIDNVLPDKIYEHYNELEEIESEKEHLDVSFEGKLYQEIYYGVPGTGKSKGVTDIVELYYPDYGKNGSDKVFRVTVHPEYSYYDFIGTIMPVVKKDEKNNDIISYNFKPGIFTQALKAAIASTDQLNPVFLIIEEMSRGNIAAIFGDIFQLLDRKSGVSEYGIKNDFIAKEVFNDASRELKLPKNLSILGTVNTSDQNVFIMDNAFKRRFDFKYVSTKPISNTNDFSFKLENKSISWTDFYQEFNRFVIEEIGLSEDKQIGQFYYIFDDQLTDLENYEKLCGKLLNYIWFDILKCTHGSKSIISSSIKSFEVAFDKLNKNENIFSDSFFSKL